MARGQRDPDTPFLSRTEVAAEQTAGEIQALLGRRARRVMIEYDSGEVTGISFTIEIQEKEVLFRLPVRWRQHLKVLERAWAKKSARAQTPTEDQARRTAWRVTKAWLEAQFALIDSGMVELQEVMLPYAVQEGDLTLYERLTQSGYLLEDKHA